MWSRFTLTGSLGYHIFKGLDLGSEFKGLRLVASIYDTSELDAFADS